MMDIYNNPIHLFYWGSPTGSDRQNHNLSDSVKPETSISTLDKSFLIVAYVIHDDGVNIAPFSSLILAQ